MGANIRDEYHHFPLRKYKCDWSENQKSKVRHNISLIRRNDDGNTKKEVEDMV